MLAHEPYSHKCADQPKDGRQEREGDVGLPLLTSAILCDVAPVEDAAAVKRADKLFPKVSNTEITLGFTVRTLTSRPKAAIQRQKKIMSTGQWMNAPENGRSHSRERNMDNDETTMV